MNSLSKRENRLIFKNGDVYTVNEERSCTRAVGIGKPSNIALFQ
ncbi:hypothetical protein SRABI134_02974 [Peribacillus sp. Bi134]|jgi:hypothetical protein|nr:hypothetical protein SRABI134_02974 [Peribacillus sp. Bi134]